MNLKSKMMACLASAATFAAIPNAEAIVLSGSSGSLAASVEFAASGGILTVTLRNTSAADVLNPADVLTGVFFNSATSFTPLTATVAANSVFYDADGQPTGGNVGGEWGYAEGSTGAAGWNRGIASAGYLSGGSDADFNGPDLASPDALNGVGYGILSTGDNTGTGNGGVTGSGGLIKDSVVFTLGYVGTFDANTITSVRFQYGTGITEPNVPGRPPGDTVPDGGATVALLGLGLAAMGASRRFLKI